MTDKTNRENKMDSLRQRCQKLYTGKAQNSTQNKPSIVKETDLEENSSLEWNCGSSLDKESDSDRVKVRYCKELEVLRDRLREIRGSKEQLNTKQATIIKNLDLQSDLNKVKIIESDGCLVAKKSYVRIVKGNTSVKIPVPVAHGKKLKRSSINKYFESMDFDLTKMEIVHNTNNNYFISNTSIEKSQLESKAKHKMAAGAHINLLKDSGDTSRWPLRESLFAHIPPYIIFTLHSRNANLPCGRHHLKWKMTTITPLVVRRTLQNSGFQLIRSDENEDSEEWIGIWGKHMKAPLFQTLKLNQKLNHFPGTFHLGRKDRLWRNIQKLMFKFGYKEYDIIPQTFVLPYDLRALKLCWEEDDEGRRWIVKPPAKARGSGIKVINKWDQLPSLKSLIVQKYVAKPYLIDGLKFDLRIYVLVTSFNPLRIYINPEGLARFASVKYSTNDSDIDNKFIHLTNYSINKFADDYKPNDDPFSCDGQKWTLSKLWEVMRSRGVNTIKLWKDLKALVIKTIISAEFPIVKVCSEHLESRYNCYELFGMDVLLDESLKPWLLEVNISPSLGTSSAVDIYVKGPLIQNIFNIAQYHFPPKLKKITNAPPTYDWKIYNTTLTTAESNKHNYVVQLKKRDHYLDYILEDLTGDDIRVLTQAEDELVVKANMERIFPTSNTYKYLKYLAPRYYNRLFDAWECKYENNRKEGIARLKMLCAKKQHLKVAPQIRDKKSLLTILMKYGTKPDWPDHRTDVDNAHHMFPDLKSIENK